MKIGIDCDGVLRNIMSGVIRAAALEGGYKQLKSKQIVKYDFFDLMGITRNQEDFFRDHAETIFLNTKMNPYANWINCISKNNRISVITSQFKGLENLTLEWLHNNGLVYDDIHFTWDKSSVDVDVLVDDYPKNLEKMSKYVDKVCYTQPYNHYWKGLRTKNMKDFVERVLPRLERDYELGRVLNDKIDFSGFRK